MNELFEYHGGLHLRDTVLWFDAPSPRQLCFVSNANIAGASGHQKILATDRTAEALRAMSAPNPRGRGSREPQALISPFGRPFALGQLTLELFPSGFVLGAASLLVKHRGQSIVSAGHINPRPGPAGLADRLEARPCDVVVLPCPFGLRRHVFPPLAEAAAALERFVRDSLQRDVAPVLLCSPLGEAQVVLHILSEAGLPARAHRQVVAASRFFQDAGFALGDIQTFPRSGDKARAVIWPLSLHDSPTLARLGNTSRALVSGLALDEEVKRQMGCDASFAISCHSDYAGLLEYVKACSAERVVLTHGANQEIQQDLEALGLKVSSIGPPEQMSLF